MRQLLMNAFKQNGAAICDRQTNWHVHGPSNPPGAGNCTNHPCAIHKTDANGILTFRDTVWPSGLLGATPRPPKHNFGRMSLISDEATIQSYGITAYALAVIAELQRLGAW